jgi:hypothetical protein
MALYFFTYDLRKKRDYETLYNELEKFNAVRILESTWCFRRKDMSSKDLRDHFRQFVDTDDGLIVSEVTDWASVKTDGTPKQLS